MNILKMTWSSPGRRLNPQTPEEHTSPVGSDAIRWRLFFMGVVAPLTAVSIGVDGGDIFQMLAVETLELDPRTVGTALLLGALSIPVQIWAGRVSLDRARHNIRLYMWVMGAMALVTALLIMVAPPASSVAALVVVVAVVGELAVSVLFATSWQPIISYALTVDQRQFINGRARAITGVVILGGAVLFGELGQAGRAAFVAVLGLCGIVVGWSLRTLPPPPPSSGPEAATGGHPSTDDSARSTAKAEAEAEGATKSSDDGSLTNVFITLPIVAFASWPLLVSYAAAVMWSGGNLGLLAGSMSLGSVLASALWRDPRHHLVTLIRVSAAVVAACSAAIVVLESPVESGVTISALLVVVAIGSAARTSMRTAIMELVHRRVDATNSVRVMTMVDVVGSTSFQVGGFLAGFLIAASVRSTSALDPYRIWLLITAGALVVAAARFRSFEPVRSTEVES